MLCLALLSHPFGTSCTVGPCEVRKGCGKRSSTLQNHPVHYVTFLSPRDVAAPFVAASYPVATARKQTVRCGALRSRSLQCPALRYIPLVALRPRSGQRLPADPARLQALLYPALRYRPVLCHPFRSILPTQLLGGLLPRYGLQNLQPMRENKLCGALRCTAMLCIAIRSAHAVKLCSHFFRLACFKLCQVVASELGAVVAKPFKHGRMNKRILYIRHVQNFGDNRH